MKHAIASIQSLILVLVLLGCQRDPDRLLLQAFQAKMAPILLARSNFVARAFQNMGQDQRGFGAGMGIDPLFTISAKVQQQASQCASLTQNLSVMENISTTQALVAADGCYNNILSQLPPAQVVSMAFQGLSEIDRQRYAFSNFFFQKSKAPVATQKGWAAYRRFLMRGFIDMELSP